MFLRKSLPGRLSDELARARRMPRRVLIIGNVPSEGGGTGQDGLAYATWSVTKHLGAKELGILFLADNVLSPENMLGNVALARVGIADVVRSFARVPSVLRMIRGHKYLRMSLREAARFLWYAQVIEEFMPHLVHVHGALRPVRLRALALGVPVLTTLHGPLAQAFAEGYPFAGPIELDALESSDFLVTVSERTFHQLLGAGSYTKPRWVIPNGVDRSCMNRSLPRTPIQDGPIRLLTVGSLCRTKNQLAVIRAIATSGHADRFSYLTVGSGLLDGELRAEARILGVRYDNVPFVPYSELPRYYRWADYHVLLSLSEGFGLCIAESLACGTPVILGEHLDICYETGIISPDNSVKVSIVEPSALANILAMIARGELSFEEKKINYPYSWEDVAAKYDELYLELIGQPFDGQRRHRASGSESGAAGSSVPT